MVGVSFYIIPSARKCGWSVLLYYPQVVTPHGDATVRHLLLDSTALSASLTFGVMNDGVLWACPEDTFIPLPVHTAVCAGV